MTYDAIHQSRNRSRGKNQSQNRNRSNSNSSRNCRYCGKNHSCGNCPAFGKKCQKCGKDNHFKVVCKSKKCDASRPRPKKGKGKRFHEISEQKDEAMDDLADQVQSLFCHDGHFNSVNTRMHTSIDCKTPNSRTTSQTFTVDTGADGNLMPIPMFSRLFPKISLEALGKTVEKGVTLFACNNTPINQYGTCSVRLSFKGKTLICKFFVVKHKMAIIGTTDSESLGLVRVNFDMIDKGVKVFHKVTAEAFKRQIQSEYSELFKGIGLMDGEINIK